MSVVPTEESARTAGENGVALLPPHEINAARFATHLSGPNTVVVTAHGELDASNAHQFADYAERCAATSERLILDLSGLDFFGTAGFSALHTINVRCAHAKATWTLVPGDAVARLLRVCDPESALPMTESVDAALDMLDGEPRRLLQLISEPR